MSQRSFRSTYQGQEVEVVTGWDPPLCHFFLFVQLTDEALDALERKAQEQGSDPFLVQDILYSSLDETTGGFPILILLIDKMKELGLPAPETLWRDLLTDRDLDDGDTTHQYGRVEKSP